MMETLSRDEAVSNLCPAFREDFRTLEQERLRPSEEIMWAANWTDPGNPTFGYWVLTSDRLISVKFYAQKGFLSGRSSFVAKGLIHRNYEWRFYALPKSQLTRDEQASRSVWETQVSRILEVNRQDFPWRGTVLVTLFIKLLGDSDGISRTFWNERDGHGLYELLQAEARRTMAGTTARGSSPTVPELLEALSKLHDTGVLTDVEFAEKKRDLLARM